LYKKQFWKNVFFRKKFEKNNILKFLPKKSIFGVPDNFPLVKTRNVLPMGRVIRQFRVVINGFRIFTLNWKIETGDQELLFAPSTITTLLYICQFWSKLDG
jgi:hypothetical protein